MVRRLIPRSWLRWRRALMFRRGAASAPPKFDHTFLLLDMRKRRRQYNVVTAVD